MGPYIMDVIYLMVLDHLFHHEFNPGWDSRYTADIPILGMFGNFLYALVPVGDGRNFKSRLVKVFKPERDTARTDSADFSFQEAIAFLEVCGATQHHDLAFKKFGGKVVFGQGHDLFDRCLADAFKHFVGYRYVLTGARGP